MNEILERITRGSDYAGKICPLCRERIAPDNEVVVCPRCKQVHHVECWKSNGGCGQMGCPQTAKAVVGEKREGDGPPPPISKKVIFGAVALIAILITVSALWPTPPDPALGRTKIVFLGEADYILQEAMTSIAAEFNGASEEIYLDLQLLPPATLEQKLLVLVAAGQAPDIAIVSEQQFPFLRDEGALLALGENKAGEAVYHLEHPALRGKIIVWGSTEHPEAARAVLDYLIPRLPIKGS